MAYEFNWQVPDKVLFLRLSGDYVLDDAREVNRLITKELDARQEALSLLIDVTEMNCPVNFVGICDRANLYAASQPSAHLHCRQRSAGRSWP